VDARSSALAVRSAPLTVSASIYRGALLAWFLILPSLGLIQKYAGTTLAFAVAGVGVILFVWIGGRPWVATAAGVSDGRWMSWPLALLLGVMVAGFVVVYPLTNTHTGTAATYAPIGGGSDRDESLQLGVREVLAGRYPYYQTTQLQNFVTQLPGSLVLAIPFALLGNAVWQNLFWVGAFFMLVRYAFGRDRLATLFVALAMFACPVVLQDFVTGGDLGASAIAILIAMFLTLKFADDASFSLPKKLALLVLTGIALSSRLNYLLLLPPFFAAVARRTSVGVAAAYAALIGLSFSLITLPFYFYDPAGFAPLYLHNKFSNFDGELRHAGLLLPAVSVLFSVMLATSPANRAVGTWLIQSGLVLTVPVVFLVALASTRAGGPNFTFTDYAVPGVFFGVIGVGLNAVAGPEYRRRGLTEQASE
jgi:hypothetical protein